LTLDPIVLILFSSRIEKVGRGRNRRPIIRSSRSDERQQRKGTTMDHVTPLYPASKFASAYCDMQDGARNLLYLFGLAGLLALVERENAAVPGRHALDVHTIAHVVRAWADCESDTWAGGFVLELNDGSRVYLEGYESDGCATRHH
jgi:hypothetical protein